MRGTIPRKMRLLAALAPKVDWDSMTSEQVIELRAAQDRKLGTALGTFILGTVDRGTRISTEALELPGRRLHVRLYRPAAGGSALPLIIAFHGGGFISGTPAQDDWLLSHLAARLPAVVASVDYRLAPEHPAPAQVADAYDATTSLVEQAARWGGDPDQVVVLGSSAGATLAALTAISAQDLGIPVRAQVLINPQVDWTEQVFRYPSFTENADAPTATPGNCRAVQRFALPAGFDARSMSPLYRENLSGLAPACIVAAGLDTLEDQSPAYADRLRAAGVEVTLTRYPEATHAFLSMPRLVPAARTARADILGYLRNHVLERARPTPG
ncbi:alpha/beta hydrolase [Nocardia goodfellowii]|uniref:Acetyl esterase n=1 Tax=Nocardia goodfellowii TaxID=882446 RepID=A0ABS4QRR8_9NOCA|nr:alpha/beta hydrolase [Nocardia goodfellowii]MBP2194233.1 acetyl esterase [Nocardia goodfellowii]